MLNTLTTVVTNEKAVRPLLAGMLPPAYRVEQDHIMGGLFGVLRFLIDDPGYGITCVVSLPHNPRLGEIVYAASRAGKLVANERQRRRRI